MNTVSKTVQLSEITYDGSTQSRVSIDESVVAEYADAITDGASFPPVVVFQDGATIWLADGFHRFHAHRKIGALTIDADVRQGSRRDAILFSVGANSSHGLRRSNADKRKAVETLLADAEWAAWSDREIARCVRVDNKTVSSLRNSSVRKAPTERTFTTKHGTQAVMKTANIGKAVEPKQSAAATQQSSSAASPTTPATNKQSAQAQEDHEAFGDFDPIKELEAAHKQIDALEAQISALTKDDVRAELQKQIAMRQSIEARLSQQIDKTNELDRELRYHGKLTADLRKATGAERNSQILSRVRAMMEWEPV
ncbi:ParB/RepB/Spo0J family partition protein [Robbsia andropogonis]|uniref:ParB/RepB/Spo0J family partition protein n=1 Tax=Robbsia andropogonis TaxID=28092 RepID=UPI003D1FFF66